MRRPHSGQALIVVLAFIASLCVALGVVFNAGQLVNHKIRLTNAADAAAYSAATWQARSLNFQAYLNRAIVANEVAIAQLVSLRSWSRHVDTVTDNTTRVAQYVPALAAPMRALERGWNAVDQAIARTAPPLEGALSHWNVRALASAQAVAHQQAPIAAADIVQQVVRANAPNARIADSTRLLQARNAAVWQHRFTERSERGGQDLRRFTRLLMDSRDGFTRSRRSDLLDLPLLSMPRRGGTDLLGEYSWRAVDSLSLHVDLLFGSQEIPLGWGAAEQRRQVVGRRGEHGGSLSRNPRASRLALRALRPEQRYLGVPEIRDVIQPGSTAQRTLTYSVALQAPADSIPTLDRLLMAGGMALPDGGSESVAPALARDALHANGTAQVYFQRPAARSDGRVEYPSLFNPYWQARLVPTPATDRQLSAPERGLGVDPFAVLP